MHPTEKGLSKMSTAAQELYRLAVESSPCGIIAIDRAGNLLMANAETQRMFGYSREELIGKPVEMLVPERFRTKHPELRDAFFRRPESRAMGAGRELFGLRKDGVEFPVEIGLNPSQTERGPVVLAVIIDIAERIQAEEFFRLAVESAPSGIVMIDRQGKLLLANNEAERQFGYDRDELIGKPVEILVPERFRAGHPALREAFFDRPEVRHMGAGRELYGLRKDGTEFPVEVGLNPASTAQGVFVLASVIDITERKHTEELFRLVVESTPNAIVLVDREGKILMTNAETEHQFQYSKNELAGAAVELLIPERFRVHHVELRQAFFQTPEARSMGAGRELFGRRKDGTEFPVEVGLNPVRTDFGQYVLASVIDITERKEAEALFQRAVSGSRDGLWDWNLDTNEVWYSDGYHRMLGFEPGGLAGGFSSWESLMHLDDLPPTLEAIRRHFDEDRPYDVEFRMRTKSGEYTWIRCRGECVRDEYGIPVRMSGSHTDISELKKREAELSRLAIAVDQSTEAVIIASPDERVEYSNAAARKMLSVPFDTETSLFDTIFGGSDDRAAMAREIRTYLAEGSAWYGSFVRASDGRPELHIDTSVFPVFNERRQLANIVAVLRDQTESVLWEARLRQAQRLESIGTLAGGIAHDFNNLLSAITGYSQFVYERLDDEDLRADLRNVLVAGERATELVKQILYFSRQTESERVPVSLHLIVKEVANLLRGTIPSNVDLEVEVDSNCPPVLADPTQMSQILMNLCTNAYQAIGESPGQLSLGLAPLKITKRRRPRDADVKPGSYALITVEDTGCGMDKATQHRVFEPFFTTKQAGEGTGLGLSTVHGVVAAHGGAVHVYSEPGVGTTFKVYLPLLDSPSEAHAVEDNATTSGNERIIVVDDDEPVLTLTVRMLQSLGYDVQSFDRPEDALRFVRNNPKSVDLVLSDHYMPRMTGEELAAEVARTLPDLPFVLMTGFWKNGNRSREIPPNINQILVKPVDVFTLGRELRNTLDAHQRRKE